MKHNESQAFDNQVAQFEKRYGLQFLDKSLLVQALTHSSYARRQNRLTRLRVDNERLEFLGDAVLKLVISEYLFVIFSDRDEGDLTKIRSQIVSDRSLSYLAKDLALGEYMRFSYGEKRSGGQMRLSNLANAMEALLGAYYLDQGLEKTKEFLIGLLEKYKAEWLSLDYVIDYKTVLQEYVQQLKLDLPSYVVVKEEGPEHEKLFFVNATVVYKNQKSVCCQGRGNTKKIAEQDAAEQVLSALKK